MIGTTDSGVPYLVVAPNQPTASTPVVVAWHLLDPPRTEAAFAAAVPFDGLDAWKVYLGLPMTGSRVPEGGIDAIMGLLATDAPGLLHGPIHSQAADEFSAAYTELRNQFGIAPDAPLALVGGSMGAAVAAEVVTRGLVSPTAVVLINPLLQLRPMIDAVSPAFGGYTWTDAGNAAAERLDYVARPDQLSAVPLRIIVGADDEPAFVQSARDVAAATGADLQVLDGMAHALADEPGVEPAPQNENARNVDALAVDWLKRHLA